MFENTAFQLEKYLILAGLFAYFRLIWYLDNRERKHKTLSDEEYLTKMARKQGTSEYDLFFSAAADWRIPSKDVEGHFNNYLREGLMPYYVKDFVRKARTEKQDDVPG